LFGNDTQTLFPVPGLKSVDGHDVFYMLPARYFPKKTPVKDIIDNLAYCMNAMMERSELASSEGIAFVAYMKDWKMANFGVNYCLQFMMMLQGRIPVRVRMFVIVDPPGWFDKIWAIMKPMLAKDFRKKVHMIHQADMSKYMASDYALHLPDDFSIGTISTDELVGEFISYRKHVESKTVGTSKN
jgi:hypothetical protein